MAATSRRAWLGAGPLLAMPLLALATIYYRSYHDEFPYRGTWSGVNPGREAMYRNTFAFAEGGCSLWSVELRGKRDTLHFSCSYRMVGNSALVAASQRDWQYVHGHWRVARTPQEQAAAPVETHIWLFRVTPLRKGQAVEVQQYARVSLDQKTGQSKPVPVDKWTSIYARDEAPVAP